MLAAAAAVALRVVQPLQAQALAVVLRLTA